MFRKYFTVRNYTIAALVAIAIGGYAYRVLRDYSPSPEPKPPPEPYSIIGPGVVIAGDLVVLTVEGVKADSYSWIVVPDRKSKLREVEGGKILILVFNRPGEYNVVLGVSNNGKSILAKHFMLVYGDDPEPNPEPEPGPNPEPEPQPEPEPDESDWVRWTYETAITTVTSPRRATQAAALAEQFRSIAAKIAAGGIRTTKEARVELRAANRRALGKDAAGWITFTSKFVGHCTDLEVAGELSTLQQYREIYIATARGLDKVAAEGKMIRPTCSDGSCT